MCSNIEIQDWASLFTSNSHHLNHKPKLLYHRKKHPCWQEPYHNASFKLKRPSQTSSNHHSHAIYHGHTLIIIITTQIHCYHSSPISFIAATSSTPDPSFQLKHPNNSNKQLLPSQISFNHHSHAHSHHHHHHHPNSFSSFCFNLLHRSPQPQQAHQIYHSNSNIQTTQINRFFHLKYRPLSSVILPQVLNDCVIALDGSLASVRVCTRLVSVRRACLLGSSVKCPVQTSGSRPPSPRSRRSSSRRSTRLSSGAWCLAIRWRSTSVALS